MTAGNHKKISEFVKNKLNIISINTKNKINSIDTILNIAGEKYLDNYVAQVNKINNEEKNL